MSEKKKIDIGPVDEATAEAVCGLYRAIYGEHFPLRQVYDPQSILETNREGNQVNLVATMAGRVVGQAVAVRSAWNEGLFELVGLMVLPAHRGDGVAQALASALIDEVFPGLDWTVRYTESTTAHVNSQRVDVRLGHSHCALALDIMPPEAFRHDGVFSASGPVSCLLSFLERQGPQGRTSLPLRYGQQLRELAQGFPRSFVDDDGAAQGKTSLEVIPFPEAGTAYLPVTALGEDLGPRLDSFLAERGAFSSVQLQLPLLRGISSAVEVARKRGFFLGGFLPQWFPEGDGLLLQRTGRPRWEAIHLLTERAKALAKRVAEDWEALS